MTVWNRSGFCLRTRRLSTPIPEYLLFLRQGILLAQRFDPRKLELSGDPLPQAEHVATTFTGLMVVSAADNGTVAFGTSVGNDSRLTWFDRSGKEAGVLGPMGDWYTAELPPDGTRVVSEKTENGNVDVWMIEVTRGIATRLTSDMPAEGSEAENPGDRRRAARAEWSVRDGRNID